MASATTWSIQEGYIKGNLTQPNFLDNVSQINSIDLDTAIFSGICLSIIILMTICGNVLVLLAVFANSHLRSTTNYFILNLASADLLLGLTVLPFSATLEIFGYWPFGFTFCEIWAAVDVLCCTASILTLCVISIDRYIGVTRPLKHSSIMTTKRAYYIIVLVWLLSVIISIAPLVGWKEPPPPDSRICSVNEQAGYVLFSASGSFYIPMLIILFVYFRIYREAIKHAKCLSRGIKMAKLHEKQNVTLRLHKGRKFSCPESMSLNHEVSFDGSSKSKSSLAGKIARFNREKKAAKTLGIVVGVFIICWFPFFFCLPLGAFCTQCHIPETLFKVIFWLGYCNSMMNPIIYACSSREFQRAFRRILRCEFRRKPKLLLCNTESRGASSSDLTRSFKNSRRGSLSSPLTNYSANQETLYLGCSSNKSWKSRKNVNLGNGCISKQTFNKNSNDKNLQKMKNSEYVKSSSESVDDSETASLSDDQMEALRLERLEIVSSV